MTTVNVGSDLIDRADTTGSGNTLVLVNNPLSAAVTITRVAVHNRAAMTGVKVGLFYVVSGDNLTCRATATLGDLPEGSSTITGLSLAGQSGDMLGLYFTGGTLEWDYSGAGVRVKAGDHMACVNAAFTMSANRDASFYGDVAAVTYYVRKDGNDANTGLVDTAAGAFLTIQKAAPKAIGNDIVQVNPGTYTERVLIQNGGSSGGNLTYRTVGAVIVDGTGLTNAYASGLMQIEGGYVTLDGFEICNVTTNANLCRGVYVRGSGNAAVLWNLKVHETGDSGIYISTDSPIVAYCEVYNHNQTAGGNEGISFSGVDQGEVKYCKVHDAYNQKEGIDFKDGCTNGLIHHNEVYHNKIGIYLDSFAVNESGIDVYANICHDNYEAGMALGMETGRTLLDTDIYNNIFYNNTYYGFEVLNYAATVTFRLINNTFYANNQTSNIYAEIFFQILPTYTNCYTENNIIYSIINGAYGINGNHGTIDHNLSYASAGSFHASNITGTNAILTNPMFANAAAHNFELLFGSPAIDTALDTRAPATDYNGNPKPYNLDDIGAFEFIGGGGGRGKWQHIPGMRLGGKH
jgi:hypothetical protein